MGTIDCIYMAVGGFFSLGCIIYGVRLAIKNRKENIDKYSINKKQRNNNFENYGTKY